MAEKQFKHLSVAQDGSVWAAGKADGTIFRLAGDAGMVGWMADKQGKAAVIAAVDRGSAWCVNDKHEIWHVSHADDANKGDTWVQVSTRTSRADALTISIGRDGSIWYAQTDGILYSAVGYSAGKRVSWVQDRIGRAVVIAAVDKSSAWCVNDKHEIWYLYKDRWTQMPTHSGRADAKSISVGRDDAVWYSDTDGAVFHNFHPGDGSGLPPWGTSWDRQQMGKAAVVAAYDRDLVWCINDRGEVWRSLEDQWQQLVETGQNGTTTWHYTVKAGDGLMAIIRQKFSLKDPRDTQEIKRLVDLIVSQNGIQHADRIKAGDKLTLRY